MAKPRIAVADTDLPNAFATGRSTNRAVLCVSTGLMGRLDTAELEGVLAHELSHVAHRDVVVMTVASFFGVLAGLVARMTFYSGMFGGRARRDRGGQELLLLTLLVMAISAAVYAISFLLIRALSRYRELAADRAGAVLTGRPSALASALTKVSGDIAAIPTRDLRTAQAFNAFFFAPALGRGVSLAGLMSTHPTLQQRLDRLARLSTELGEVS
jgi:heat shock protein HtpX